MKRLRILSHGPSESLDRLVASLREADGLDVKKLKRSNSSYRYHDGDVVFNYGCSSYRNFSPTDPIFNSPSAVAIASNKLSSFQRMNILSAVEWTQDRALALQYLRHGATVYCRTILNGSQGNGIVVATKEEELVAAPLYTIGYPCYREIRVHVFAGEVIHWAIKKKRNSERLEAEELTGSPTIRNLGNGWVFCREDEELFVAEEDVAKEAVSAIGLDYGAVDIVTSVVGAKVLEVNTAPGMEGSTLQAYKEAILRVCGDDNSFSV